jgi:hypothetical protein
VAEDGAVAAREDRGEPAPLAGEGGVADGVHARVEPVQPGRGDAALDGARREPEGDELGVGDDAVLARGQVGESVVG